MRYVSRLSERCPAGIYGPKAAALSELSELPSLRVPEGFALAAEAFEVTLREVLAAPQWPERLLGGDARDRRPDRLESIRQRLVAARLPEPLREEITSAYASLGEDSLVAVRSSALHEDAEGASAAGLQETFLGVLGVEGVLGAVLKCYASIYRERALSYLMRRGQGARAAMGVVVQRMVRAEVAGVLFTVDPLSGDRDTAVIEAAYGLGTSVVDGTSAPDVYRVSRATGRVTEVRVGAKALVSRVLDTGGVSTEEVPEPERLGRALSDAMVTSVLDAGLSIERSQGGPRDVEWAIEGGLVRVLQARPIVRAHQGGGRESWVWSNVNVGEALPGVATPLTWSIAAAFSDLGFRRAFASLGCVVPDNTELVGNFHGRIYLNLTTFMQIASQVPALSPRMLLEFGGGGGLEAVERQVAPGRWGPFLRRLPVTGVRYVIESATLDRRVGDFEKTFMASRHRVESTDFTALTDPLLGAFLSDLIGLLDHSGAVMLTCASGYLASIVGLRGLLKFSLGSDAERFGRDLLTGVSDLESAAPGIALFHIAELARTDPGARAVILGAPAQSLTLDSLPEGPVKRAFRSFLKAYGYRCPREAELSTPRWRESPGTLFAALRAWLERPAGDAVAQVDRQRELRDEAERALTSRLSLTSLAAARHLLARTQRFARLRERMRARVTEVLGFFRTVALELCRRMLVRTPECGESAAFYLTLDELRGYLSGDAIDVVSLARLRRAEVLRDMARPDPPPSFVGSPPMSAPVPLGGDRWEAVGASPGVVTGRVRVLLDPSEGAMLRPGEVLVTQVADVGWTPLFLVAAAVITELGGALSHAALVAREYGVPAVVNVTGITRMLATGDLVRVDGDRGVVERVAS